MIKKHMFFTGGIGVHREKLISFELALRDAGIAHLNLVRVSSIFPPNCEIIECSKENIDRYLSPGEITFCVLSENSTNEQDRLISASIGVAMPRDRNHYGYLSEHHAFGLGEKEAGLYAEDLAAYMLGTTLGLNLGHTMDVDPLWHNESASFVLGDLIVKPFNITKVAHGTAGLWTTVIAVAVFC